MHNGSNKTALFERHSKQLNNNAIWERYLLCKCRNEGGLMKSKLNLHGALRLSPMSPMTRVLNERIVVE